MITKQILTNSISNDYHTFNVTVTGDVVFVPITKYKYDGVERTLDSFTVPYVPENFPKCVYACCYEHVDTKEHKVVSDAVPTVVPAKGVPMDVIMASKGYRKIFNIFSLFLPSTTDIGAEPMLDVYGLVGG